MSDDFMLDTDDLTRRMDGAMGSLKTEFASLRTGRASASMIEPVMVEAYGQRTPVNQVGTVNVPEPRMVTVNVWDNETQEKLNAEPRRFAVFERGAAETVVGSGLTQNKAAQLENLSRNAALKIQNWILENPEWIGLTVEDSSAEDAAQ